MSYVVHTLVAFVLLFVVVWLSVFGGFGAALARSRGSSTGHGFAWGATLGPAGWMAIWWRTRDETPREIPEAAPAEAAPAMRGESSIFDEGFTL
jgi:hypothetical protein